MKVKVPGFVTVSESAPVQIHSFVFEREGDEYTYDEATLQSIAAETATKWALKRLQDEVSRAQAIVIAKLLKAKQAEEQAKGEQS